MRLYLTHNPDRRDVTVPYGRILPLTGLTSHGVIDVWCPDRARDGYLIVDVWKPGTLTRVFCEACEPVLVAVHVEP
jgi:hypothetical protein